MKQPGLKDDLKQFIAQQIGVALRAFTGNVAAPIPVLPPVNTTTENPNSGFEKSGSREPNCSGEGG